MADILPTGVSVAMNARMLLDVPPVPSMIGSSGLVTMGAKRREKKGVCVVIGCGPVRSIHTLWTGIELELNMV